MKNLSAVSYFKVCFCIVLLYSFANCTREQEKPQVARQSCGDIASETTLLATIAADEKPMPAIPGHGVAPASPDQPASFQVIFSESGRGVAYLGEKDDKVYVVHNGRAGKLFAAVGDVVLSSDGRRITYAARADGKWRMVVDGKEGRRYDVLLTPIFSPDGQHVAYQAKEGEKWYVVVDDTPNVGTTASYTAPEFNSDSTLIAYVEAAASNRDMRLIVSDLTFEKQHVKKSIGDLLFTINKGRTRIAAAQVVGNKLRIIDFSFAKPDVVHAGLLYDVIEKLTFGDDGVSVSYCALKGWTRLLVLDNREEILPKGLLPQLPVVRPDKKGVGVIIASKGQFFLHEAFSRNGGKKERYDEAADLVYSKDSSMHAYAARKGNTWLIVVNGKEGPAFDRVVTPVFSPDGKLLVCRARKNGKRFVVIADVTGKMIRQHPSYEMVFPVVFTADGKSVAYGVKDGNKLIWRVEKLDK